MTIDQWIIKKNIYHCFDKKSIFQVAAVVGADQHCVSHLKQVQEGQAPYTELDKPDGFLLHLITGQHRGKKCRGDKIGDQNPAHCKKQCDPNWLWKHFPYFMRPVFTGPAGYQRLQPTIETIAHQGKHQVIDTGDAGCAQFHFT